jgi:glycosyltransferase involved in cell wall biosynthesis
MNVIPQQGVEPKSRPVISVLINNFNNGPWLKECIDSVLSQSQAADEIIVYDDGSEDDSLSILRAYGAAIRLIEGEHDFGRPGIVSQGNALAVAFAKSRGDHLYTLDGDDKFLPGKIEAFERIWAEHPNAALVQSPMQLINQDGIVERDNYDSRKHRADYLDAAYRDQDCDHFYAASSLAFSRTYLEEELPLDYSILDDAAFDARLSPGAIFCGPILTLRECYSAWRQRDDSMSRVAIQRDPYRASLRRHQIFNDIAQRRREQPIRLWRNFRFYRQVARKILPRWFSDQFAKNREGLR